MTSARRPGQARVYGPWIAFSAAATLAAATLRVTGDASFERFLGPLPPVVAVAAAGAAGLGALGYLERRGFWRRACRARTLRGLVVASVATVPFAAVAIAVDVGAGFPRETNVPWPQAWLLYPAVALLAEAVFHLLALAALVWAADSRFHGRRLDPRSLGLIAGAAAVEPAVQVALGTGLPAFTVVHVYIIGLVQLALLRRYGYPPMLWFRLAYYLLWHILWGAARLELLF